MTDTKQSDVQLFYKHGLECLSPGSSVLDTLTKLGPITEVPMEKSNFVKPRSLMWSLNGRARRWDMVESHASVGIVIYNIDRDAFVIVRQFRPAVFSTATHEHAAAGKDPPSLSIGFTHELCAGILDKDLSLKHTAAEEIEEECGYKVDPEAIQDVTSYLSNVGITGSTHHLFYTQVDDSMRVSNGGGEESAGESIEVLALPVDSAEAFVVDASLGKSPGLMFGLLWAVNAFRSGAIKRKGGAQDTASLELKPVVCA